MTIFEVLSLLISLAGSVGVVFSLWLLYRQTGIFNRQLMESVAQSVTSYSLEVSRLFLQHPDLRPYFFDGQAIEESHPDYLRAEAVAEVMLDIFWTMMSEAERIQDSSFKNAEGRVQWAIYMGDCFANSPLLTSFLRKRQEWYGPAMLNRMEEGLARAQQKAA